MLSTAFYAGPRLGELRDLPWRNVDFDGSMLRIESGFSRGHAIDAEGQARAVDAARAILAQRLAALATRDRFTADADYVFSTDLGERVGEKRIRQVFYAALGRAGLGHRRDDVDPRGNPQLPIRLHDLRHSWCTWAVNVWPLTKVQAYAGHRDVKTTQRYVHHQTKTEDADPAARIWTRRFPDRRAAQLTHGSQWLHVSDAARTDPGHAVGVAARRATSRSHSESGGFPHQHHDASAV